MRSFKDIVIAIVFLLLVLSLACSENPALRARYQAEKMFFQAEKTARTAHIRPDLTPTGQTNAFLEMYRGTLDFAYKSLDSFPAAQHPTEHRELAEVAFRAATRLSQYSFAEERFDNCVVILRTLLERTRLDGLAEITSYLNLGRAYQSDGQWDSALAVYGRSLESFYPPVDSRGEIIINLFNLPNHIYDVYLRVGDTTAAETQVGVAEAYYRKLIADNPGGSLAGAGHLSLAGLYERMGRFEDAVNELSYLTDTTTGIATSAQLRIASLQASQLNRPELAIEQYDEILSRLTGRDTLRRPMVLYNKGLVHLYQEDYSAARQTLVDVKRRYPRFFNGTPTVQFAIARTFELQENWDRAETEYKYLINNFPASEQSLSTYLYLIDQYSQQGRMVEAERMEERAEAEYDELATTRPGTIAEAAALSYKAELYRRRGEWQVAVDLLTGVFREFPTTEIGFRDMVTAALICRDDMNDQATADILIQELKRRLTTIDESPEF
jgi:tetratricopeptide (TPR) repeat protein